ncbi:uncharacterized protein LOC114803659 [Zeugodacus cucurbitae]|uniref:uncharacterized protein LOC114803659 n=1 Tax=Zeugodacus cucurbitae TaxID=28588 RepID=UPI0023D8FC9D|nr:uncharacterized protein LOC114803659 [Zeugodacus cucurbitae]
MAKMAESARMLICCLILVMYSVDAGSKRNYAILLDRVNYTIHQKGLMTVEQFQCGKNMIGLNTFTLHLKVEQNITNFQLRDNLRIIREKNITNTAITNITNACDMLSGDYDSTIIKQNVIELQQSAKPLLLCPLMENALYTISNFTLRPSLMPPYIPVMSYIETLEIWYAGVHYLDIIFEGRVTKA